MSRTARQRIARSVAAALLLTGASFLLSGHEVVQGAGPPPSSSTAASLGLDWKPRDSRATTTQIVAGGAGAAPADEVIEEPTGLPLTFAAPQPVPTRRRAAIGSGTWAVVIGIDDYPGDDHDLKAAVADTNHAVELLDRVGSPTSQRRVLRDGEATPQAILQAFDWLVANAGPDATAIVFYAGHARTTDGQESLVGADGRLIRDGALADRLAGLEARRAWIVISACFGGGFTELLAPGRVLTAAAPAGERAYETTAYRASYLVEYMVRRALVNREAASSLQEAFNWTRAQLEREHPGRVPVQIEREAADFTVYQATAPPRSNPSGSPPPHEEPAPPPPAEHEPNEPDGQGGDTCKGLTLGAVTCGA